MDRRWTPVLVGAVVVVATLLLAQWPIFEPSADTTPVLGNAERGAEVFESECSGCHGPEGEGGSARRLAGSGLEADQIIATIENGTGVMPPDLVEGGDLADVATYVVTISQQP